MSRLLRFIDLTLDTRIAPMVYIIMGVSVIIGFCFATGFLMVPSGSESVLYDTGVLVHRQLWGAVLFCTATAAEFGFIFKKPALMKLGGIAGFMAWLFAAVALTLAGHYYILLTVAMLHLLFHGYVYLATSTGYIYRQRIED